MTTAAAPRNSIRPALEEAERAVREAIAYFGLKTDPHAIVVTVQSKGKKNALGWFRTLSWDCGTLSTVPEINLSAECLRREDVGETILHELAHAENFTLGVKDCAGRAHNKQFKAMAEKLGLECLPRDRTVGFGFTKLADAGRKFLESIKFDAKKFDIIRLGDSNSSKKGSRLRLWECQCPKPVKVRVASDEFDATCNLCGEPFELR